MIYVDSNVPMYLVGAEHPHKRRVVALVPQLLSARDQLVTSAETFQELLHRYRALGDPEHLSAAYDALEAMISMVADVTKDDDRSGARPLRAVPPALLPRLFAPRGDAAYRLHRYLELRHGLRCRGRDPTHRLRGGCRAHTRQGSPVGRVSATARCERAARGRGSSRPRCGEHRRRAPHVGREQRRVVALPGPRSATRAA